MCLETPLLPYTILWTHNIAWRNFAHCLSMFLRLGKGGKHKIFQMAVFLIIFVTDCGFPSLRCFDLVSVSSDFPSISKRDAPSHQTTFDYVSTGWDRLSDNLRDLLFISHFSAIIEFEAHAGSNDKNIEGPCTTNKKCR